MPAKLIFFDLDGTLIDGYEYIYSHLWEYFGVDQDQTRPLMKKYMAGELSYKDWVKNDVRLLQEAGATKSKIQDAAGLLRPMKGAFETLGELRRRGYKIYVVSGGIDTVINTVYPQDGKLFDGVFINRYHYNEEGHLLYAEPTKYDMEHKATCIKDLAEVHGVQTGQCVFVGDNVNDLQAALTAGTSIAFNAKSDELIQAATHCVESNDLRDILPLLP